MAQAPPIEASSRIRTRLPLIAALALTATGVEAHGQGYAPAEAAARMTVADGLRAHLVASEPLVRQPVCIEFDDRGRLWVIQYLQYPNPAGLKRVEVDRYSRTRYDAIPPAPPRGPKGDDRITILEDVDGDGVADRARDFLSGLNLASGLAFGRGGVYVLQAPYLLFYPDRNRDDRPDGDPEVLLSGFGLDDAHSVANSLTWGPDGWLYGVQGSTVTARVRGYEFQQGVWRYHPVTRAFELFCEGGGNMWGLDFDDTGRLLASTNVGGHVALHAVQGAWCWKSVGKHGALHNPYSYGYFDHALHQGDRREGHVSVGGLFYLADRFPDRFHGRYIAADLLGHAVRWYDVEPRGSTVATRLAGDLLVANDTWFAPSDLTLGPDGALYIADWHDRRTAHPDPDADWDRSNGRVYRVAPDDNRAITTFDLATVPSEALLARLSDPNAWFRRRARRLLAERRDPTVVPKLREAALRPEGQPRPLEALWTLAAGGWLDDRLARRLLDHPDAMVRAWTIRLLGDAGRPVSSSRSKLVVVAGEEPSVVVRAQLAASARRFSEDVSLDILIALLDRDRDADDPHVPLLLWWAVERLAISQRVALLERLATPAMAGKRIAGREVVPRLIRRYAAQGTKPTDLAAARLLTLESSADTRALRLQALADGLAQRRRSDREVDDALRRPVIDDWQAHREDPVATALAARLGHEPARERAIALAADPTAPEAQRLAMLVLLAALPDPPPSRIMLAIANGAGTMPVRLAALDALARDRSLATADLLLAAYNGSPEPWRARVRDLLLAREGTAELFLRAVDSGRIDPKGVPLESLRVVATHAEPALDALVRKHWGQVGPATPEAKLAEVRRLGNDLRAGPGDARRGRQVFLTHCAGCHKLFGEGTSVGPELTYANRSDREFLLVSLVDPSAVVRKEYQSQVVATIDGRVHVGLPVDAEPGTLALIGADGRRIELRRDDVESVKESPRSLMPDDLYRRLSPDDLRDLFRYIQSGAPAP